MLLQHFFIHIADYKQANCCSQTESCKAGNKNFIRRVVRLFSNPYI